MNNEISRTPQEQANFEFQRVVATENAYSNFFIRQRDWIHGNLSDDDYKAASENVLREFTQTIKEIRKGEIKIIEMDIEEETERNKKSVKLRLPSVNPLRRKIVLPISFTFEELIRFDPELESIISDANELSS